MSIRACLIENAQIHACKVSAEPQIRDSIHAWIRHDTGPAIQMSMTPQLVDQLLARITAGILEEKAGYE